VDGNDVFVFGGITNVPQSSFYTVNNNDWSDIVEYSTKKQIPLFTTDMDAISCQHQCSAYNADTNNLYMVAPITGQASNEVQFWKCNVDMVKERVRCWNLCEYNYDTKSSVADSYCSSNGVQYFRPCVTQHENYMFIIGGELMVTQYKEIYVYDMTTETFLSEAEKDALRWNFGPLRQGVELSSCAFWNDKLYVFGGDKTNKPRDYIQVCEHDKECELSETTLSVGREYGRSKVFGSEIIIACGSDDEAMPLDVVEIYDAETDTLRQGPPLSDATTRCCLVNVQGQVVVAGGITSGSSNSKEVEAADYGLISNPDVDLTTCKSLRVSTASAFTVDGLYTYDAKNDILNYKVWYNAARNYGIFYDQTKPECWIGGGAFWMKADYGYLESGEYTVLDSLLGEDVVITCEDSKTDNGGGSSGDNKVAGLSSVVFITLVCVGAVLVVMAAVGAWMWRQRKGRVPKQTVVEMKYKVPSTSTIFGKNQSELELADNYTQTNSGEASATVTVTKAMLFSHTKSPEFEKDIEALNKGNESDSEVDGARIVYDTTSHKHLDFNQSSDSVDASKSNPSTSPNAGFSIATEHLFPDPVN
jgi:hypothetical protein